MACTSYFGMLLAFCFWPCTYHLRYKSAFRAKINNALLLGELKAKRVEQTRTINRLVVNYFRRKVSGNTADVNLSVPRALCRER